MVILPQKNCIELELAKIASSILNSSLLLSRQRSALIRQFAIGQICTSKFGSDFLSNSIQSLTDKALRLLKLLLYLYIQLRSIIVMAWLPTKSFERTNTA